MSAIGRWRSNTTSFMRIYAAELVLIAALAAAVGYFGYLGYGLLDTPTPDITFSNERALAMAARQMEAGPRPAGSEASQRTVDWIVDELGQLGWEVYIQRIPVVIEGARPGDATVGNATEQELTLNNIIAVRGSGPTVLVGAHYDSRLVADGTPETSVDQQNATDLPPPVPGANGGAAGPAVLLELARSLDVTQSGREICLLFFDGEENGGLPGWRWFVGSDYLVANRESLPRCGAPTLAVLLDDVGAGSALRWTPQSDADLGQRLAAILDQSTDGALQLLPPASNTAQEGAPAEGTDAARERPPSPLILAGIPTLHLVADSYPARYTANDTLDRIDTEQMGRLGRALEIWLEGSTEQ